MSGSGDLISRLLPCSATLAAWSATQPVWSGHCSVSLIILGLIWSEPCLYHFLCFFSHSPFISSKLKILSSSMAQEMLRDLPASSQSHLFSVPQQVSTLGMTLPLSPSKVPAPALPIIFLLILLSLNQIPPLQKNLLKPLVLERMHFPTVLPLCPFYFMGSLRVIWTAFV